MLCPHCGNEHPDKAKFCPVTGETLVQSTNSCPNCGREIDRSLKFCTYCGQNLSQLETGIPAALVPSPPPRVKERKKEIGRNQLYLFIGLMIIGVFLIAGGIYYVFSLSSGEFNTPQEVANLPDSETITPKKTELITPTPKTDNTIGELPTETPTIPAPTEQVLSTDTLVLTPTETISPTPTNTEEPLNQPIALEINPIDGAEYVLVPAGEFLMGSESGKDPYFWGAEGPEHMVFLDEYWIYRTEVTNGMYQACVEEQKCPKPQYLNSVDVSDYYGNPEYDEYPVIHVTFTHAQAYCNWAGGKLPTEAQWEKAARGNEGNMFPWGNDLPDADLVNLCDSSCARGSERENHFSDGYPGTSPVGSFPNGASPYGALDMAGNVWEWTSDYFQPTYYSVSPDDNPLGPNSGTTRTIRGGSWTNPTSGIRTTARTSLTPGKILDTLGFRCIVNNP